MGALVLQAACIWETYYRLQALLAIVNTYLVCNLYVYFPSMIFLNVPNSGWLHAKGGSPCVDSEILLKSLAQAQSPKPKSKGEALGQSISLGLHTTNKHTPPHHTQTFRTLLRHLRL